MYKVHKNCRACGYGPPITPDGIKCAASGEMLESVLNLGVMPLPNAFRAADQTHPGWYPVELLVCPRCNLGQLSAVVDPEVLYSDYAYVTSPSETMRLHFDSLWEVLSEEQPINTMVEIGSNDGLLLDHFRRKGARGVLGIDPAANLAKIASDRGIQTIVGLFNPVTAVQAASERESVDLILARHVFCHVDNWQEFVRSLRILAGHETLICIEVPYAQETIDNCEWDQVYAEHLSYLNLQSIRWLLKDSGLHLHHIVKFPIHGGAIAILLRVDGCKNPPRSSVETYLASEHCSLSDWKRFADKAKDQIVNLKLLVQKLRGEGKRVTGYGASAKSTVWINACKFTNKDISCVYDCTTQKLYCNIPGTNIPVVHEGAFYANNPHYSIVWAWNFLPEILRRQEKWIKDGGKFIVPVPEVRII